MLDAEGLTMQTITLFVHVAFENAKYVRSSWSPIWCWCLAAWFV